MPGYYPKYLKITFLILVFLITTRVALAGTIPPVTTVTQTPSSPDGDNDWYVSPVRFDLQATDLNSGVESINYRIDGGSWQTVSFSDTLNLVQNPSFETAGATTTGILYWEATTEDAGTIYSQDPVNYAPNFATSSAKITTTTAGTWHGVNNKDAFAVTTAFENMTASVWLKTQNVTDSAYFKVYSIADDGFGGEIVTLLTTSATISGTTGWTPLSVSFSSLPASVTGIYIDVGLEGAGTVWADAATINSSSQTAETTVLIASDNENHTFEYYAKDQANNEEAHSCIDPKHNCIEFKLDTTPPGNWSQSGAIRCTGAFCNDHTLWVFTNVDDVTSGLSIDGTDEYQYRSDTETVFGRYIDLTGCLDPWQEGSFVDLEEYPSSDGVDTAYLKTQQTDLCNDNWQVCKVVRFHARDMAGNTSTKDYCINGPWVRIRGEAIVRSNHDIDMVAEPEGDNTDGLISIGGSTSNFFTSTRNWEVMGEPPPSSHTYAEYWNMVTSSKTDITGGDLVSADGVYYTTGNYTIDNQAIPNDFNTTTLSQIVFIDGDLTIDVNVNISDTAAVMFIVSGNVNIDQGVDLLEAAIIADGDIFTAYNAAEGAHTKTLEWYGLLQGDRIYFQRTLQGTNNEDTPAEDIVYEAKYLVKLRDFFGKNTVSWRSVR